MTTQMTQTCTGCNAGLVDYRDRCILCWMDRLDTIEDTNIALDLLYNLLTATGRGNMDAAQADEDMWIEQDRATGPEQDDLLHHLRDDPRFKTWKGPGQNHPANTLITVETRP